MTLPTTFAGKDPSEIAEDHALRSQLVQHMLPRSAADPEGDPDLPLPRLIIQFWDDARNVPADVRACIESWAPVEELGIERLLFDDMTALDFIRANFGERHALAFGKCHHPAMRADYFRLCFILRVGGVYVDADDVYLGQSIESLFADSRLAVQPLCYDIISDSMVEPFNAAVASPIDSRIFYVNNNPLVAPPGHPIIAKALERATSRVLSSDRGSRDIQSLTGPGNLTACLVEHAIELERSGARWDFVLLPDWNSAALSRWPLDYRSDSRNWRNWVREDV